MSLEILKWECLMSKNGDFLSAAIKSWPKTNVHLMFNFLKQIRYLWNRQHLQMLKIIFSKRWLQNYKVFNFESLILIRSHCSKKDTYCERPRKLAELRARRVRGNSVVRELLSGSWQGNDDRPYESTSASRPTFHGPDAAGRHADDLFARLFFMLGFSPNFLHFCFSPCFTFLLLLPCPSS